MQDSTVSYSASSATASRSATRASRLWSVTPRSPAMSAMVGLGDPQLVQIGLGDRPAVLVLDQGAHAGEQSVASFGGQGPVTRVGLQHGQVVVGGVGDVANEAPADGRGEPR